MKRILLLFLVGGIFLSDTIAQKIEIGAYYGGQLSIGVAPDMYVELTYDRMDSRVSYYYNNINEPLDMSTEYFQIGAVREVQAGSENLVPFGLFSIGATRFDLKESYGNLNADDYLNPGALEIVEPGRNEAGKPAGALVEVFANPMVE